MSVGKIWMLDGLVYTYCLLNDTYESSNKLKITERKPETAGF
jgi:hypothetical protein